VSHSTKSCPILNFISINLFRVAFLVERAPPKEWETYDGSIDTHKLQAFRVAFHVVSHFMTFRVIFHVSHSMTFRVTFHVVLQILTFGVACKWSHFVSHFVRKEPHTRSLCEKSPTLGS